jgi:hypothetical protein
MKSTTKTQPHRVREGKSYPTIEAFSQAKLEMAEKSLEGVDLSILFDRRKK